jgi:tetratricopeptide (TPR) repeat protein
LEGRVTPEPAEPGPIDLGLKLDPGPVDLPADQAAAGRRRLRSGHVLLGLAVSALLLFAYLLLPNHITKGDQALERGDYA